MRAVLGILLIGGGLVLAYLILSGKFPPTSASSSSTTFTPTGTPDPSAPADSSVPANSSGSAATNVGLPTMSNLAGGGTYSASNGGYIYA